MSRELDKLIRTIDAFKKMNAAARRESTAAKIIPAVPTSKETGSPSPTSEQPPNESSAQGA